MRTIRLGIAEEISEGYDWSDRLSAGETLSDSIWTIDAIQADPRPLTGEDATFDNTSTEVHLSGGTQGNTYLVSNQVQTSDGLSYEHSFKVIAVEK